MIMQTYRNKLSYALLPAMLLYILGPDIACAAEAITTTYQYNDINQLIQTTEVSNGVATVKTFTYDPNGNMVSASLNGSPEIGLFTPAQPSRFLIAAIISCLPPKCE